MKNVNPNVNFNGNTREVFDFYRSVFGGEFSSVVHYRDLDGMAGSMPEHEHDKIAHIALPLGEHHMLMGSDVPESFGDPLIVGNNFSITLEAESGDEAERLFNALSDGGKVGMPLDSTEWAEKFGFCTDRFGVHWMVNYTGSMEPAGRPDKGAGEIR